MADTPNTSVNQNGQVPGNLTEAELAAAFFNPVDPETLARMNAELEAEKWNINQRDLQLLMGLAFGLLAKTKAELIETASTEAGIAAMDEAVEAFREKAEWLRSAVSFLDAAETRIMVAYAAANHAEETAVRS